MKPLFPWLILLVVFFSAVAAPSLLAGGPGGTGPLDALMITGEWQTLAPNSSLWYLFDYTGDRSKIDATLDANGIGNVQLSIYTPAQAKEWLQDPATKPVGTGTRPSDGSEAAIHDLIWQGNFNFPGRFFAVVSNGNPAPVSFRLRISGTNVTAGPTLAPTPGPIFANPYATPVPTGSIQGRLVFQESSGGYIYTVNGDGSQLTRVTDGLDPSWSPDGTRIAFTRWHPPTGVFVANADGSNLAPIFAADRALSPQWSPNGASIAFARQSGGTQDDMQFCFGRFCFTSVADPHWKMGVVDVNTGLLTQPQCSNHCFSPTWKPDNRTLAYADATFGILTTDIDPNVGPAQKLYSQNPVVQSSLYSPDGDKIVFQVRQHDHWEINVMNADGSNVTPVTRADPLSFTVVHNVAPTWSPDGKQILFLSDRNGKWEFFLVNLDGSGLTQVLKSVTDAISIQYNFSNERVIDWIR